MDAFETSVGYQPLSPSLRPPQRAAIEPLPVEELLRLAREAFDADLAERLRSAGEWHWKLEVREVAEEVAATLSTGSSERYERLRAALLAHYEARYRSPTEQEWRTYLRRKRSERAGADATRSRPGGAGGGALYYLDDSIADRDPHDFGCPCALCDKQTYKALGVSLYLLDVEGLQAYRDFLLGADDDRFGDWCNEQESQATIYGPDEPAAVANALAFAQGEGWLVANYAGRSPHLAPLIQALGLLVGEDGYLTQRDECDCEMALPLGETLCRVCFASLVFDVLTHR